MEQTVATCCNVVAFTAAVAVVVVVSLLLLLLSVDPSCNQKKDLAVVFTIAKNSY